MKWTNDKLFGLAVSCLFDCAMETTVNYSGRTIDNMTKNRVLNCRASLLRCIAVFDDVLKEHSLSWPRGVKITVPAASKRRRVEVGQQMEAAEKGGAE